MLTGDLVATRVADCLERILGMGSSKGKAIYFYDTHLLTSF